MVYDGSIELHACVRVCQHGRGGGGGGGTHGGIVDDEEHRGGVGDAHQHTRLPERSDRQRVVHVVHLRGPSQIG